MAERFPPENWIASRRRGRSPARRKNSYHPIGSDDTDNERSGFLNENRHCFTLMQAMVQKLFPDCTLLEFPVKLGHSHRNAKNCHPSMVLQFTVVQFMVVRDSAVHCSGLACGAAGGAAAAQCGQ